jgi:hypothetical protein
MVMLPAFSSPPRTLVVSSLSISWTSRPAVSAIAPPPALADSVVTCPPRTAERLVGLDLDRAGGARARAAGRDDGPIAELDVPGPQRDVAPLTGSKGATVDDSPAREDQPPDLDHDVARAASTNGWSRDQSLIHRQSRGRDGHLTRVPAATSKTEQPARKALPIMPCDGDRVGRGDGQLTPLGRHPRCWCRSGHPR